MFPIRGSVQHPRNRPVWQAVTDNANAFVKTHGQWLLRSANHVAVERNNERENVVFENRDIRAMSKQHDPGKGVSGFAARPASPGALGEPPVGSSLRSFEWRN